MPAQLYSFASPTLLTNPSQSCTANTSVLCRSSLDAVLEQLPMIVYILQQVSKGPDGAAPCLFTSAIVRCQSASCLTHTTVHLRSSYATCVFARTKMSQFNARTHMSQFNADTAGR